MLTQLATPIPLKTPKGKAWAVAIIDYGPQWDLQWVTFIHDTGECWTFRNSQIRQERNYTFNLPEPTPIAHREPPKREELPSEGAGGFPPDAPHAERCAHAITPPFAASVIPPARGGRRWGRPEQACHRRESWVKGGFPNP